MSCQKLIQEDPYVFTDTTSNSATLLQQSNSQIKYAPLNRQTIYSRQFEQHEPSIDSSESDILFRAQKEKSQMSKSNGNLNTSLVRPKKNGLKKEISAFAERKSSYTSPKVFKFLVTESFKAPNERCSDDHNVDDQNSIKIDHNSIKNSSQQSQKNQEYQKDTQEKLEPYQDFTNRSKTIKYGVCNDKYNMNQGKLKRLQVAIKRKLPLGKSDKETNFKTIKNSLKHEKHSNILYYRRWKKCMKPQNIIVESIPLLYDVETIHSFEHHPSLHLQSSALYNSCSRNICENRESSLLHKLSRDERLSQKKIQLSLRAQQFHTIQNFQVTERSKMKFCKTLLLLKYLDHTKREIFKRSQKTCLFNDCSKEAIVMTQYCNCHILCAKKEQKLIRQCCFLHENGEQCHIPVHDVAAKRAVCQKHESAVLNHQRTIDSIYLEKVNSIQGNRVANSSTITLLKNSKKKLSNINLLTPGQRQTIIIHPNDIKTKMFKASVQQPKSEVSASGSCQFIHQNSGNILASSQSTTYANKSTNDDLYLQKDLMTICENSYESSEDTGVGGLSENELMSHDVIGSLEMECSDELTKVLSSLATNTLDDILTEPLQTSRDDEEYLDRAIEEVSTVGIDQIAITAFDHLDGLGDMLEMMDDEEQRQMISAATNLISMSSMQNFLMNHDQDYTAMPSPMMS
ncbi:CLUMA_CG020126, isoform A [Clunio marinus]|uniref:CLUMA_CG020126, isoform A n=1 Tax=Clunio marinus TaxID=568069 RepID=A0A1J1J3X4_9DIPT|nr:CLUMA_CG020126, isoform A [Clunio marinus]